MKMLVWLLCHNNLLIGSRIASWGRRDDNICIRYQSDVETHVHVIRDYPEASRIWIKLVAPQEILFFFGGDSKSWILNNLSQDWGLGKPNPGKIFSSLQHGLFGTK